MTNRIQVLAAGLCVALAVGTGACSSGADEAQTKTETSASGGSGASGGPSGSGSSGSTASGASTKPSTVPTATLPTTEPPSTSSTTTTAAPTTTAEAVTTTSAPTEPTVPETTLVVYNGAPEFCSKVTAASVIPADDHGALADHWDSLGDILPEPYATDARIIASAHQSAAESGVAYSEIAAAEDVVAAQVEYDGFYQTTC